MILCEDYKFYTLKTAMKIGLMSQLRYIYPTAQTGQSNKVRDMIIHALGKWPVQKGKCGHHGGRKSGCARGKAMTTRRLLEKHSQLKLARCFKGKRLLSNI